MSKITKSIIAIGLCALLGAGGVCAALAQTDNSKTAEAVTEQAAVQQTTVQENTAVTAASSDSDEVSKDETVYVLAGADGTVQKIIVSDWIKNAGSGEVYDKSELTDIENVKGDETYTMNGDGMTVWDAEGNDIYYRGNTDKELPVGMSVSYKLDGETVSAEELAGKSGKVTIRFDYENRSYETVEIDGEEENIYVPFAMLTGMILDNGTFSNVEISNGKLINDGDRTIAIGLALPGLQEDLDISEDKLEIPSYVEITADATNFELGTTVTVATNELFNGHDTTDIESAFDEVGSLSELSDAMTQLIDGSSALYDGLCTLLDKSSELISGIDQLADGAKAILDGAESLDSGAAQLKSGLSELSSGLDTLSANSSSLNSGAKQVFNTLLSTAASEISKAGISIPELTIDNYSSVLDSVIASLDETSVYNQALDQVTSAVNAKRPEISEKVTAAVREQVTASVTAAVKSQVTSSVTSAVREQVTAQVISTATGMSKADYDSAVSAGLVSEEQQSAVNAAIDEQMASESVQATIDTTVAEKMESDEIKATISANVEEQMASETVQGTISQNTDTQVQKAISENMSSETVQSQLSAASAGAASIISLKSSLDSYNAFYLGLLSYTGGVDTAASGADKLNSGAGELKDGTAQLRDGAQTLYNGILTLKDGAPALVEGVTQLKDGAMELSDGMKRFNEEGIQKLIDFIDGDLTSIATRLKATMDVSNDYCNYSGISDDMSGQVKFIYRTDEISAE